MPLKCKNLQEHYLIDRNDHLHLHLHNTRAKSKLMIHWRMGRVFPFFHKANSRVLFTWAGPNSCFGLRLLMLHQTLNLGLVALLFSTLFSFNLWVFYFMSFFELVSLRLKVLVELRLYTFGLSTPYILRKWYTVHTGFVFVYSFFFHFFFWDKP